MIERRLRPFTISGAKAGIALLLFVLGACTQFDPTPESTPAAPNVSSGNLSPRPLNDESSDGDYRRVRLARAMVGLVYEDEHVTVDPAYATPLDDVASSRAATERGHDLLTAGFHVEAIRAFTEAVVAASRTAPPYRGLGLALIAKGRTAEARAALRTGSSSPANNRAPRLSSPRS